MDFAVLKPTGTLWEEAVGAWLGGAEGVTVMLTMATFESWAPSLVLKLKLSGPL
jgi:hypothetical protein